ncbi:hypothetical protein GJAV_G00243540 [Gymnothorax javanicus]|nr:hypothetical protein GJAV_G00243540 [Gymnothorax javanicus]
MQDVLRDKYSADPRRKHAPLLISPLGKSIVWCLWKISVFGKMNRKSDQLVVSSGNVLPPSTEQQAEHAVRV